LKLLTVGKDYRMQFHDCSIDLSSSVTVGLDLDQVDFSEELMVVRCKRKSHSNRKNGKNSSQSQFNWGICKFL